MKRSVLLVVLFLVFCPSLFAQKWVDQFIQRYRPGTINFPSQTTQDPLTGMIRNGAIPLSIGDLITLTLDNNLDIAVNRLSPLSSEYSIDTNYRPFEPTLRMGVTVSRDTSPSRTQLTGIQPLSQLSHSYTVGFTQAFQTGTDVAVDFSMNRGSSNNAFNTFNPSWLGLVRYSFNQRLLNGFGRNVNSRGIRVAQNNKTLSEIQFELQVINLVVQAQKTYWDLVFVGEDQKVKETSLGLAQKTLNDNRIQVEVGTLARIDLIQAESQVATQEEQLTVSKFNQLQFEDQVKKLLTNRPDPGLVLARVTPTQGAVQPNPADVLPPGDAVRVALENRPELRQARIQLQNSDIDLEYSRNQLLPTVDFSATYAQNGVGGRETLRQGFGPDAPIIRVTPGGFTDAFGQMFGYNYTGYSFALNVQIPLRNRAAQAEHSRVLTQRQIAENNIKAIEQQIALEVRNALTQVEMNVARIAAAEKSRILADEKHRAEQRKFELGASTVRFVLEEQRNLEQMQSNELSAKVNYAKALVDYERALGLTLKKNNVEIERTLTAMR
jgi:outer membrane protein TolC